MISAAYVHIPFCAHLCSYCAFEKSLNLKWIPLWKKRILQEIEQTLSSKRKESPSFFLDSLYFGGGTPSVLSAEDLAEFMHVFRKYLHPDAEITLEVNPETVDSKKLKAIRDMGINRLSIGVQSFHDDSLKKMNRHHDAACARQVVKWARKAGFDNLSVDLIFAFPWQTLQETIEDVQAFLDLDAEHISIYSFQLEENSVFGKQNLQTLDEEAEADAYEKICSMLSQAGYEHYEISSFAKSGRFSRHNLIYWSDQDYFGFGYGACGRDEKGYYENTASLMQYIEQGYQKHYLQNQDPAFEAIMMGLRTCFGIDLEAWQKKYKMDFIGRYGSVLEKFKDSLEIQGHHLKANEKGMEILNTILVEFMMADC